MKYERRFLLQSSHFNGALQYSQHKEAQVALKEGEFEKAALLLSQVMPEIHGHNFEVFVEGVSPIDQKQMVVDDVELEELVMQWNNCCLSVHPDFLNYFRATTEGMVSLLIRKLRSAFPNVKWSVSVQETENIVASESS